MSSLLHSNRHPTKCIKKHTLNLSKTQPNNEDQELNRGNIIIPLKRFAEFVKNIN